MIVINSDLTTYAKQFKKSADGYNEYLEKCIGWLDSVEAEAFSSGAAHDSLKIFNQNIRRVRDVPQKIGASVNKTIANLLLDIDKAQTINGVRILYGEDFSGKRDYTWSHFYKLKEIAQCADYDSNALLQICDAINDFILGCINIFGTFNNSKSKHLELTHAAILQYNDVTERRLRNIFRNIDEVDAKYAAQFQMIADTIKSLCDYICIFKDIMQKYSLNPMEFNLDGVNFNDTLAALMHSLNTIINMNVVTDKDVEEFVNSEFADSFLNEHVEIVYGYLGDLSGIEIGGLAFWEIIIFQMFDVAEGQITSGDYEKMMMKKELVDMMDDLANNYVYSESYESELIEDARNYLSSIKKSSGGIYDYLNSNRLDNGKLILDGRTKEAIRFRNFLQNLDDLDAILEGGQDGIELVSTLFVDYNRNLEFLDSFERNVHMSDEMKECFEEIKKVYNHDLDQMTQDAWRMIKEKGVDALYSVSVGKTVGAIKKSIGIVGDVTGANAQTAAKLELLSYGHDIIGSTENAFHESVRKLREADKTSENYSVLVSDVKNCYSMYKSSLCRMFEKMAVSVDGPKKDYFYYCSSQVSNISLKDYGKTKLMSYDEYLKDGYAC